MYGFVMFVIELIEYFLQPTIKKLLSILTLNMLSSSLIFSDRNFTMLCRQVVFNISRQKTKHLPTFTFYVFYVEMHNVFK